MDTPGQMYEFNVDVVNDGTIDAMIETATNDIVTDTLTDEQKEYLDYSIKYVNGANIEKYDKLAAGETKTITVKLLFRQDIEPNVLPSSDQIGIKLYYGTNYVQADNNVVNKITELTMIDKINSSNYGEYVDLGTNILDSNSTKNDWRILYKDTTSNQIYLILADYLPNENEVAEDIGLTTTGDYIVSDSNGRVDFMQKINSNLWKTKLLNSDLLTKYSRIDAKGTVKIETFINSWNDLYSSTKRLYYTNDLNENGYNISTSPNISSSSNSLFLSGTVRGN